MYLLIGNFLLVAFWGMVIYGLDIPNFKKKKWFLIISYIQIVLVHSLFDYNKLPDLPFYADAYNILERVAFIDIFQYNKYLFEPGWVIYCKLISYISPNFTFFLLITSIIMFGCYYKTIDRYSLSPVLSVLFILVTTYFQSLFVLRQHLCMAILLLSYPYIIERKFFKFIPFVLLTFTIHYSSLIFLPLYFLYGLEKRKQYIGVVLVVGGIVSIMYNVIFLYFGDLLSYSDHYIMSSERGGANYTNVFIMSILLILYIVALKNKVFNNGINRLILSVTIFALYGSFWGVGIPATGRLFLYFTMIPFLLIPNSVQFFPKSTRIVIVLLALGLYSIIVFSSEYVKNFTLM